MSKISSIYDAYDCLSAAQKAGDKISNEERIQLFRETAKYFQPKYEDREEPAIARQCLHKMYVMANIPAPGELYNRNLGDEFVRICLEKTRSFPRSNGEDLQYFMQKFAMGIIKARAPISLETILEAYRLPKQKESKPDYNG